jgi:cobalt-zinc-cadmium efflux system outer membrane protein
VIGQAELASQRDKTLQKVARQRINPEAETKIVAGNENRLETENSLLHTVEVGGKRQARIKQATAQKMTAEVNLLQTREEVALHTVFTLYRLRQIRDESNILGESLHIYKQLVEQLKKRIQRTPEQEVSLSVFELAQAETHLKRTELTQEGESLTSWLEWATGLESRQLKKYLPAGKKRWPKIETALPDQTLNSSEVRKAYVELKKAEAERKLATAKGWPDFKLGPTLESAKEGNNTRFLYGGRLAIPLPILSQNRGERKFSALEVRRAEQNYASIQNKTALERFMQAERYRLAVRALGAARSTSALNKMHQDIDARIEQGFIPASLVIEAHRQIFEAAKSRNEQEWTAVDALWRIAIIDGRVLEEKI